MKLLPRCDCGGSLHEIASMRGRYYCPTCKRYFEKMQSGWKEVHA